MTRPARLSLVKWRPEEDEPLTATALRERLQTQAAAVSTLANDWAARDEPVSFKDFEPAIREMAKWCSRSRGSRSCCSAALREDQLMRAYPAQVEREGRRFRRAPTIIKQDLELGSGSVEGAVKNIIGKRCDHGGMRWIEERIEAIVQLRCIEANGDWDHFVAFVHDRMQAEAQRDGSRLRPQSSQPAELPSLLKAA